MALLVGVVVGYKLYTSGYAAPRRALLAERVEQAARSESLQLEIDRAPRTREAWELRAARAIASAESALAAHRAFRADVQTLIEDFGFSDYSVKDAAPRTSQKGHDKGFVELPVVVTAEAHLADVVDFLRAYYQRYYLTRVDRLSLRTKATPGAPAASAEPAAATRSGARNRASPPARRGVAASASEEPLLSVSMTLTTLVPPALAGSEHAPLDLDNLPDPLELAHAGLPPLLGQEDAKVYDEIVAANPFRIWRPPPPPPAPVVVKKPEDPKPEPAKPPPPAPPPPPPPPVDNLVVVGSMSLGGDPRVFVQDTDALDQPLAQYHLNDEMHDGRVVLIHTSGVVVRASNDEGESTDYFYELGANFEQRVEVNSAEHPEIDRLLGLVFSQAPAAGLPG